MLIDLVCAVFNAVVSETWVCPEILCAPAATRLHVDEHRVKDLNMDIRRKGLSIAIKIISHCLEPWDLVRSDCVTKVIYPLC